MKKIISVCSCNKIVYPGADTLFRPDTAYPEYLFSDISQERNDVYAAVRNCFIQMKLDEKNIGKKEWNPLAAYVKPGDNVLIKPNLVMDVNLNSEGGTDCLYTQPGVVAAVVDYVLIALQGKGKITIGDAPMQECNFAKLLKQSGYRKLIGYYKSHGVDIKIVDFRELSSVVKKGVHYTKINDEARGKIINLGEESEFYEDDNSDKIRITNYDPRILPTHHNGTTQEYYISDYVLDADVIINMPKPKTHRKAGVTISMKNFVGANVRKEFLPHHTMGSVKEKGDEYLHKNLLHKVQSHLTDKRNIFQSEKKYRRARLCHIMVRICDLFLKYLTKDFFEGSWYGNHTISRTICDLNKIILYADKNGKMQEARQRKVLIVADMVISGEKEGPVNPSPKNVGVIAVGDDMLLFDEAITKIMGFDPDRIPTFECIRNYRGIYKIMDEDNAEIVSDLDRFDGKEIKKIRRKDSFCYIPTSGWKEHIECK